MALQQGQRESTVITDYFTLASASSSLKSKTCCDAKKPRAFGAGLVL